MAPTSRHLAPVRVGADDAVSPLTRMRLGESEADRGRREAFVQKLIFDHPELIPMLDIEPAFTPLVSVCMELGTRAGSIDNVWVTPAGGLVLGECKLVRNPQARREVVAQVLDYARAIGGWRYEDLEREVRKALKQPSFRIWSLVENASDLEEHHFVDAVDRRLRAGRIMLLIIGDGIQEGVEALAEHLQLHAGIHAGMALVDLSLWEDPAGGILVVPRVPMRTVLIERGIVVADGSLGVRVEAPASAQSFPRSATGAPRAVTASEPEFYAQLDERKPGLSGGLRTFLTSLEELGVEVIFRRTAILRLHPSPDTDAQAGIIGNEGKVWFDQAYLTARRLGAEPAFMAYLEALARAIGGRVALRAPPATPAVLNASGRAADAVDLLQHQDEWRGALSQLVEALRVQDE